jgi:ubiquinone/menaquinone biosynthesis C-methylase UbiE
MAWRLYQDWILPRCLDLAMRNGRLAPYRQRLLSKAKGRVLEIGVGSGLNLAFYSHSVTEIVGLEPHPKLLAMARRKPCGIPLTLVEGSAEAIPLDKASVDMVVSAWTLCSIPNVALALREARRVLRPDGKFLFVEHGLAPEAGVRRWQHRLNPAWKRLAGGCHLNRPISDLVAQAGFEIDYLQTGYLEGPRPLTFTYEGGARRCNDGKGGGR